MFRLVMRQDRAPRRGGMLQAVAGSLLVVGVVTLVAAIVYRAPTMREIVLVFGINAVFVVGYHVFVGNTGIVSFGHIAFSAIGAYTAGIVTIPARDKEIFLPDLPPFLAGVELGIVPSLLAGGLVAASVAAVAGFAIMRLSGPAASIATLGLLIIVTNVLGQATPLTRGPQSLFGIPERTTFFWVFISLAAVVCVSAWFKWSGSGLRARAVRDDPDAARASGVSVLSSRLKALTVSAFITGVGGALYAQLMTALSPDSFYIPQLVVVITMAIVGGIGSITGAMIGSAVITVINELLRRTEGGISLGGIEVQAPSGISAAVLGVALIVMLRWLPQGITGPLELQVDVTRGRVSTPGR